MLHTTRTFPYEYELKDADVCLVGIPWDSSEIGKSVKHGPLFIREALKSLEGFDPESGINPFEKLKLCDLGDIEIVPSNWSLTSMKISETIEEIFNINKNTFPIFLGGDHLITLGILNSLKKQYPKLTVVQFDAHADISPNWMGESFSHITWAYHALKTLSINLVQIGTRSMTAEESELSKKFKISNNINEVEGPVYLTVDLDVLDPAFAPEVGTPEPVGLNPKEFFELLKKACKNKIIGMDIVECASDRVNTPTALVAGQIIKTVLAAKNI